MPALPAIADVRAALDAAMPDRRRQLEALMRIPSVSHDGHDPAHVHASAVAVAGILDDLGLDGVRLLEVDGAHPAVAARWDGAGDSAPTVLFYAHHDVQPTGDETAWTSPPFAPTERDGRLYGRGAADDKAGVLAHVAAVGAWLQARGSLPVNVRLFIEGEEEIGSPTFAAFLDRFHEDLTADVVVVTDLVNWSSDIPALTYALRGLVECTVEVRALRGPGPVHSGMYGGPVPDPVSALAHLVAGLVDEHGAVALPALRQRERQPTAAERERVRDLAFDQAAFRAEAGLLAEVPLAGQPDAHPLERLWLEPHLTVTGLDAPAVTGAANAIQPAARAKLSLRLAPGQDPQTVGAALVAHLQAQRPLGCTVTATPGALASPFVTDTAGAAFTAAEAALAAAYGTAPVLVGVGGTIPLLEPLQQTLPDAEVLLLGVEDPASNAHGIDESLHLGGWRAACLAEAYLLGALGEGA